MSREAGRRVFLSIAIPVGAVLFIAVILWAFSRVLLAVDKDIAPVVALLFALNILVGSALAAILRGRRSFALVIGVMVTFVLGAGIAAAFVGEQPVERHVAAGEHTEADTEAAGASPTPAEESPTDEPAEEATDLETVAPAGETVEIAADNLEFDTGTLELPAETQVTIAFDNRDTQPHNVAIYTEEGGEPIFQGEVIEGGTQIEYTFETPEAGEYYFQCDVHPFMNGTVVVG